MPDDLTGREGQTSPGRPGPQAPATGPGPGDPPSAPGHDVPPPAPPVSTAAPPTPAGRPPRRPSWLRAALLSLVVLVAGSAVGAAGYRAERGPGLGLPAAVRTGDGWLLTPRPGRELSGLGLSGTRLIWQDGASIEFMDVERGKVLLLGPGPGMRTTWDPAIGDPYAIWFEAERAESVATEAVVYDTRTGRRWVRCRIGSVFSYPAVSGERAVWSSAVDLGDPALWGVWITGGAKPSRIAPSYGAPVVSGDLVVWARSWTGPFTARELTGGATWQAATGLTTGKLTGLALSGRTLVWGQGSEADRSGTVVACAVDGGDPQLVATAVTSLAGPTYDGRTVVWADRTTTGGRVLARRLDGGEAFVVAEVPGAVTEVAVSGGRVAWIERGDGGGYTITVTRLPR